MWERSSIIFIVTMCMSLSASVLASSSDMVCIQPAAAQQSVTLTYNEYNQLSNNLNQLEQNSKLQQQRISQLETLLETASLSTSESTMQLLEAKKALNEAKVQIDDQQMRLQKLNALLATQSAQLSKANTSLQIAEQSLNELQKELRERKKAEKRNKALLLVATAAALYLTTK